MKTSEWRLYGDDQLTGMDDNGFFIGIPYSKPGFSVQVICPVAGMIALYGV